MTLAQVLACAGQTGLEPLDAQLLLLHVLGRRHDRAWLYAHDRDPLPAAKQTEFKALCARRQAGEPVAYLIGEKEFLACHCRSIGACSSPGLTPKPWCIGRLSWPCRPTPV